MIRRFLLYKSPFGLGLPVCMALLAMISIAFAESPGSEKKVEDAETAIDENSTGPVELDLQADPEMLLFMDIKDVVTGSLTATDARTAPSAITTITAEDIQASGARSIFELLDIYVPNFQWIRHHYGGDVFGLRGINAERQDKFLLLVNGRILNERTSFGAISETDLVMLQDIHHIDIARGPGSAVYGPGAVSMVINIITYSAETFEGTEIAARVGAIEEFYDLELKHTIKSDDGEGGWFLYGGLAKYLGADQDDAPLIASQTAIVNWGRQLVAGEPYPFKQIRDWEAHRGLPPLKFHVQLNRPDFELWARYTRGGKREQKPGWFFTYPYAWFGPENYDPIFDDFSVGYQQFTIQAKKNYQLSDTLSWETTISYDMLDYQKVFWRNIPLMEITATDVHREDEYHAKTILNWMINEHHQLAAGGEFSHEEFGLDSPGFSEYDPISYRFMQSALANARLPRWSTNMFSVLGEYHWNVCDHWDLFLGGRGDKHSYTEWMFSPRGVLVWAPDDKNTITLNLSRSVRANFAEEMHYDHMLPGRGKSDPEILHSGELRYDLQANENWSLSGAAFYHDLDIIGLLGFSETSYNGLVGSQKQWGCELETRWKSEKTRITASHGFVKLLKFELAEPFANNLISSEPYDAGNDLANWSNHISKLTLHQQLTDQLAMDGSMRVYWGFPGMRDYERYMSAYGMWGPQADAGFEKTYRCNAYLNLGLEYKPTENLTLRVDGHNLLGLFDENLNKRNYYNAILNFQYRQHAPAVSVSLSYRF